MDFRAQHLVGKIRSYVENSTHHFASLHTLGSALVGIILIATPVAAETIRIATYNVSLGRKGPGLLLKALMSGEDEQIASLTAVIQHVRPDILLLNEFDHDSQGLALAAFRETLAGGEAGIQYSYSFAPAGNEGRVSYLDIDGDGEVGGWADGLGFGKFPGSEGMALLSRFPLGAEHARSFNNFLWKDLPAAAMPKKSDGTDFFNAEVKDILPFSNKSHWDIPVVIGTTQLNVLASHATPPVFDGAENANGLRNAAENGFWVKYLAGAIFQDDAGFSGPFRAESFVLLGDLNIDPYDGEGSRDIITSLLSHPRINDVQPRSHGAAEPNRYAEGANSAHIGDPAFDTVEWDNDIGNMRVDYVLPSIDLHTIGSGVFWPLKDNPFTEILGEGREGASNHHMVWIDIDVE